MTFFSSVPLTWTCMVCKDTRPDAAISVHTSWMVTGKSDGPKQNPVYIKQNVRYCNDKLECRNKVSEITISKLGHVIPENEVPLSYRRRFA